MLVWMLSFVFYFTYPFFCLPLTIPVGAGSAELLEIQRATEFGNVLWFPSLALVLHSRTASYLGYPPAFLYSWLCDGTKTVSHLSRGSDLDSASIQVISSKHNYCLSPFVFFSSKLVLPRMKKDGIQAK